MESLGTQTWRLNDGSASLQIGKLSGVLQAAQPAQGLSALQWNRVGFDGHILGVTAGTASQLLDQSSPFPQLANSGGANAFVRGDDFVANFPQVGPQPFSCQIYWRAVAQGKHVIVFDTIISVQTELLESFPQIAVESRLPSDDVWIVDREGNNSKCLPSSDAAQMSSQASGCLVLRDSKSEWSYVEMAHPDDCDAWRIEQIGSGEHRVQRQLGGAFLEKGVIRRLRVRGAFVPRQNDLRSAADCYTSLAAEVPPLTA